MNNLFGKPQYSLHVDEQSIVALITSLLSEKPQAIMLLCCDEHMHERGFLNTLLPSLALPIFGGIFPKVIYEGALVNQGIVAIPVNTKVEIEIFHDLVSAESSHYDLSINSPNVNSAMILVDGLSRNIDHALNQIFEQFGQQLKVFGGGAGSLSFEQKPCLFTNQGVLADAMLVIAMQHPWELAIGHGWEILEGPFMANQVDDNCIIQLNFQPAFDVYKEVVERFDNKLFEDHDFFDLAKTYPFGLDRLDDDLLVRDPVTLEGTSLVCVGKVPENTMLYILKGQHDTLVSAAVKPVQTACSKAERNQGILFDCISRQLFLEKQFSEELDGISAALNRSDLCGALVLGEIASGLSGAIHFHNKTAVTALTGKVLR